MFSVNFLFIQHVLHRTTVSSSFISSLQYAKNSNYEVAYYIFPTTLLLSVALVQIFPDRLRTSCHLRTHYGTKAPRESTIERGHYCFVYHKLQLERLIWKSECPFGILGTRQNQQYQQTVTLFQVKRVILYTRHQMVFGLIQLPKGTCIPNNQILGRKCL
jgi:hypothetical protein